MEDNKKTQLPIGTLLYNGRYRIDRYLASGGFGNTYEVTDMTFNEKFAVKELFIKDTCNREDDSTFVSISIDENKKKFEAQRDKFRKEAKRIRQMTGKSKHIVRVHDLFDENNTSYYVMDFIEGESLSAKLKRDGRPMPETEVMLILPQILDALEAIHDENIWHLDIKPGNIMVDKTGNVTLIDFGASKQTRDKDGKALSTSSQLAYTPGYAPSEQKDQNFEKFGPWTDLYALGATLFNLLTSQNPPVQSDIDEDLAAAMRPISGASRKMYDLIVWLMKSNRTMRPQSVEAVRTFLAETPAKPKPADPKPEKPVEKTKDNTVLKGGNKHVEPARESKKEPAVEIKPEPDEEKKSSMLKPILIGVAVGLALIIGLFILGNSSGSVDEEEVATEEVDTAAVEAYLVNDTTIHVDKGADNLHDYIYSGYISSETNLPVGDGVAQFSDYKGIPGGVYEGQFIDGVMTDDRGKATFTFENGDTYKGTVVDGYYEKGEYYVKEQNITFKGTFKNGNPYNGNWLDAQGNTVSTVTNGK